MPSFERLVMKIVDFPEVSIHLDGISLS